MKDASGQISNTLSYDLKETEQGYQVTLHLDKDWLNDAVRVYPVEIVWIVTMITKQIPLILEELLRGGIVLR